MSGVLQTRHLRCFSSPITQSSLRALRGGSPAVPVYNFGSHQRRDLSIAQLDNDKRDRQRVVILGSGWAGFTIARRLNPKLYQAIVVSPRSYFVFTPLLASTSVGTLEFRTALEPVRSITKPVEFLQGWADDVDFASKRIAVEEAVDDPRGTSALTYDRNKPAVKSLAEQQAEKFQEKKKGELFDLTWDKLIIAVGCYNQTFGTPGVRENAMFLKDVSDARRIRNRLLTCFETASLPTTTDEMRKNLLNFAIVGGGPTGIEFSAELHDLIREDMGKLYPTLMPFYKITVYDIAPKVLSMFDEKLGKYALKHLQREGVQVKTSHHVEELRRGSPKATLDKDAAKGADMGWTLKTKEEGEVGVGMCVWSTGLMMNPFVEQKLAGTVQLPKEGIKFAGVSEAESRTTEWLVKKAPKSGGVTTDDKLRVLLQPKDSKDGSRSAVMQDVYALGDCAVTEGTMYPATAQVASQKAEWLAKRFNARDIDTQKGFNWKNMGVMAYLGNWNAVLQSSGGDFSGRTAWFIWRGAYLTKAVSWRNKILIPTYWFINWLFGRDVSRF
ncbi:hypothetical protein NA57DRAFT_64631 [Rhizodiscina lignyota]|uniref:FAD/NAD(P)-binding domain-containing protein n=1 Tax=Rhizodiscina lignyota TaxID=1504668 RepID=A0A9P4IPS1_9PEZI|nr:hypothetical protein NA57DRAFT_64631 [Rhizodiscina lignyota]